MRLNQFLLFLSAGVLVAGLAGCGDGGDEGFCGDGSRDPGETCDGDCPLDCDDGDPCTVDTLAGSADTCDAECRSHAVTRCTSGDGCCPEACDANQDGDCSPVCGNGAIESGETCDPPASCPASCDDENPCTVDTLTGSAQDCDARCSHAPVTVCTHGDGCCPSDCTNNDDDDCSTTCGNDSIEEGETCDPPATCPTVCQDFDACTGDILTGSPGNCNAACTHEPIVACAHGDGCCPPGCDAISDDDCMMDCGFNPGVSFHPLGEILQLESADENACVWLRRKNLCPPDWICMAVPFQLQEIRIGHDGSLVTVDDPDMLSWSSTHHNWTDVGEARTPATTYRLEGANFGNAYLITASGGESWGPILLEPWVPE